ncbi:MULTISPECIES: glutaredoxin 3 [Celeribacter]|jgi:glutaredoxin 3|uniref:Glutaredoxin n=1 Tax=Celeribacter halophilus TaxID=576117 RepID=A0AAW7XWP5_9RHOB|nr:glutaredoxin 3 [Celeribacter halophilus]MBU2889798.1 glutaredoxin 3 [Celeribacter halophilus]MDO6458487.1 glutaredoxin 3 [Celeribacter halophilus]MDO6512096.1 glutaredoxin 3 [Celeribacter halophilus]MDO6724983.1 glutaredoxin 3 [Celeribacter halophilus]
MQPVTLYTTPICPFCIAAKRLLDSKGVSYTDIDVMRDPSRRKEMMQKANGGHTVPQIFIGETHVGGCDELHALERAGKLDALLAG